MKRGSGILLHITSLPSKCAIGDLGPAAYEFADFLERTNQKYWQVLPLNPTNMINCNSPYSSVSAFAVNTLLISPQILVDEGLLDKDDLNSLLNLSSKRVDYESVYEIKDKLFRKAYVKFKSLGDQPAYNKFCQEHDSWLNDYARFIVFKEKFDKKSWSEWPKEIRDRNAAALSELEAECKDDLDREKFFQYLFYRQWFELKKYCNQKGIALIGDIPIYVTYDSVDVWTNSDIFKLDSEKSPEFLAGVPPDYFSETGQLWGNPVYDWEVLKRSDYEWWVKRIEHNLHLFDIARIDHFRGFIDFWQVPRGEDTAINGSWEKAPAIDFFDTLLKRFTDLPIIAEDLGIITDDVKNTIKHFNFPGMKILLFAFYEDLKKHPYLPHNYIKNCVAYTGTHDNNTVRGWFENELTAKDKKKLSEYLKIDTDINVQSLHWDLIELLMNSVADMVILPMQDILGLGQSERMNLPGTAQGNWGWRLAAQQIDENSEKKLIETVLNSSRK